MTSSGQQTGPLRGGMMHRGHRDTEGQAMTAGRLVSVVITVVVSLGTSARLDHRRP